MAVSCRCAGGRALHVVLYTTNSVQTSLDSMGYQAESRSQHGLDVTIMSRGAYALSAADPQK